MKVKRLNLPNNIVMNVMVTSNNYMTSKVRSLELQNMKKLEKI